MFAARDGRVEEFARQHGAMLGRERDDDGWIFRTLRVMDHRRIGGSHSVEFAKRIFDLPPVEAGDEEAIRLVDAQHGSKVAIEDIAIVSVLGLHYLILSPAAKIDPNFSIFAGGLVLMAFCKSALSDRGPSAPRCIGHRT